MNEILADVFLSFIAGAVSDEDGPSVHTLRDFASCASQQDVLFAAIHRCWAVFDSLLHSLSVVLNVSSTTTTTTTTTSTAAATKMIGSLVKVKEILFQIEESTPSSSNGHNNATATTIMGLSPLEHVIRSNPPKLAGLIIRILLYDDHHHRAEAPITSTITTTNSAAGVWAIFRIVCEWAVRCDVSSGSCHDQLQRLISPSDRCLLKSLLEHTQRRIRAYKHRLCDILLSYLLSQISNTSSGIGMSVSEMEANQSGHNEYISSGCGSVDSVLSGTGLGFKRGQVTHIYGEAGAGKSQIGLSTLVDRASRGFGAVYLVSEDIPQGRLREIAESVAFRTISSSTGDGEDVDPDSEMVSRVTTSILERIFVRKIQSMTHLHEVLGGSAFTSFLSSHSVEVVVMDSFAGSSSEMSANIGKRQRHSSSSSPGQHASQDVAIMTAAMLNEVATRNPAVAVVVLNQVRADTRSSLHTSDGLDVSHAALVEISRRMSFGGFNTPNVIPALSSSLTHFVHAQLFLCKMGEVSGLPQGSRGIISLCNSSAPSGRTAIFQITAEGLL